MKTETSKILNKTSIFKTELKILLSVTSFENKLLSLKLKGYKIICLKGRVTRLQERKDYKSLSKGERERGIFFLGIGTLKFEPKTVLY